MKVYKDVNALLRGIQKDIGETLKSTVAKEVKSVMKDEIEKEVYIKYNPRKYKREMDDGGLTDEDNINVQLIDETTLVVESSRYDGTRNVSEIVETGKGYMYNFPYAGVPRPFTESTIERIQSEEIHMRTLKDGLIHKGYEVK